MNYTLIDLLPIVLSPFLAFVLNSFIVKKWTKLAVGISCAAIFVSAIFATRIFCDFVGEIYNTSAAVHLVFNWFDLSFGSTPFKMNLGFYLDNVSSIMLLMVTWVAFLIHIFSTYYMKDDKRFGRFFVYLSLFTSAMLGLVLSDNLLSVFIFWEIMGFCSYSLIGFYYENEDAGNASLKAFMTTRVGDVFFLLGILAIWSVVGNVTFVDIYQAIEAGKFAGITSLAGIGLASFAGFCIFMGTIGKSAQFPLQVWLPDAMFGPTPCSALIHAATMVAAGVYLSFRMLPLMELGGLTPFMAYIGAITAFGAATIALIQTDIKAVLAYSTISQLGYMVLGLGVGAYHASLMHLITHAIFKACLFLSAGSVIHSLHDHHTHAHVQDMTRMGGLRKKMPFTFWAMMLCTLAISGVPFFSGFVSKDRILGEALIRAIDNNIYMPVAILGFSAAALTAFYMFRMMFLTFFGAPKDQDLYDHTHVEKLKWNRNVPLLILATFTLGVFFAGSPTGQGFVNLFGSKKEWFQTLVTPPKAVSGHRVELNSSYDRSSFNLPTTPSTYDPNHGLDEQEAHRQHSIHVWGALLSILVAGGGILLAFLMYLKNAMNPGRVRDTFKWWDTALKNKYYFDFFYLDVLIKKVLLSLNRFLAFIDMGIYDRFAIDGTRHVARWFFSISKWFDNLVIDTALVDGQGLSIRFFNVILRTLQSGRIQFYLVIAVLVLASYLSANII